MDIASVFYNGETLFSLTPGQSGTLLCSEQQMEGNIIVRAEESFATVYNGEVEVN